MTSDESIIPKWIGGTGACTACGHTWTLTANDTFTFLAGYGFPDYAALVKCPKCGVGAAASPKRIS